MCLHVSTFCLLFRHVEDVWRQKACWFWHPYHGWGHSGGNGSSASSRCKQSPSSGSSSRYSYAANHWTRLKCACSSPNPGAHRGYVSLYYSARLKSFNTTHFRVQTKPRGFVATGAMIVRRETPLALYKGLGAVLSGIVPKMAIRFASFESYKGWLADRETGKTAVGNIFLGAYFPWRGAGI